MSRPNNIFILCPSRVVTVQRLGRVPNRGSSRSGELRDQSVLNNVTLTRHHLLRAFLLIPQPSTTSFCKPCIIDSRWFEMIQGYLMYTEMFLDHKQRSERMWSNATILSGLKSLETWSTRKQYDRQWYVNLTAGGPVVGGPLLNRRWFLMGKAVTAGLSKLRGLRHLFLNGEWLRMA